MTPLFLGIAGPSLTADERALFAEAQPAGFILFKRNITTPAQLAALTATLRELASRADLPILIDQEGGRVARMQPPHWPAFPAHLRFAELFARAPLSGIEAARLNALALALMLRESGITVNCLPLLDVVQPGAHDVIGDRAYGSDPQQVASLGSATLLGLRQGGVVGVVKHIPGHGRARVDSHLELPVVDASRAELETDFAPFRALRDAPMAMTAHVVYSAIDAQRCATLSPRVIDLIRTDIGFDGLLMSDDLGMKALGGSGQGGDNSRADFGARALSCLEAGCDIALHCSGDFAEMRAVIDVVGPIGDAALDRLHRAMAWAQPAVPTADVVEVAAMRDRLLALA